MSNCQHRYENYGSYLRTRGNDAEICLLKQQVTNMNADLNDAKKLINVLVNYHNDELNTDISLSETIPKSSIDSSGITYWNIPVE